MSNQIIIALGREFGSGGHYIAQMLSSRLGIKLYDKDLLEMILQQSGYDKEMVEKYDEKPVNLLLSRKFGSFSNSIEENMAEKIFDFIKTKADEGESFIVVGRCAEQVLRNHPNAVSIFVLGNLEDRINRIMRVYRVPESKAVSLIKKMDRKRQTYHNYFSDIKWGDSRGYNLTINVSKLGIERTVDVLINYIDNYMGLV